METQMAGSGVNIYVGAASVRTALGNAAESMLAMDRGEGGLRYNPRFRMHAGMADVRLVEGFTRFESFIIEQLETLAAQSGIALSCEDVQLVISTTKGNVELLAACAGSPPEGAFLGSSAQALAAYFGCAREPLVVSNACISGLSALIVARKYLLSGECRHAVVVGCDVLSEFITEGFASFRSISPQPCRPYDAQRDGLSLGEACGALLLTTDRAFAGKPCVRLAGGAITNDANHISGPSRTGDGLCYAIAAAMAEAGVAPGDVGFVNTHGTATRYNDEMESKAVAWAGLDKAPLNSIKGYIGHTLGASGIVETAICIEELRRGSIVGTKGFSCSDTPCALNVSPGRQDIATRCCVKTASGFGGCNAAIVLDMEEREAPAPGTRRQAAIAAQYSLPQSELPFADYIRQEFRALASPNTKFYKMSDMCKALYIAVERLLEQEGMEEAEPVRRAIVLANNSASLDADMAHQAILDRQLPEAASPAVFVYTLANVAAGEMCIRHRIQGDNTFFVGPSANLAARDYADYLIATGRADVAICGWCEYLQGKWQVDVSLLKQKNLWNN